MTTHTRKPFRGHKRKLVLAYDIGTTYSGISYAILDPGKVPEILSVTRFPGHDGAGGDLKIPSILYYDAKGIVRAAGAEATLPSILIMADEEQWTKAEWFKLHFRPKNLSLPNLGDQSIAPLPLLKTAVDVFADFLRYLHQCALQYIQETHHNGESLWNSVKDEIEYVLSHPNGWGGIQQENLRTAALLAALVPDHQAGQERIQFVTEGEACLHFCVAKGLATSSLQRGDGVVVIDAGGGTIDISTYCQVPGSSSYGEIAAPDCLLEGSAFVTRRAEIYLQSKLVGSRFGYPDVVRDIAETFDKTTKHTFRKIEEPAYVQVGTARDRDPGFHIRAGQLKLSGDEVASFFQHSVQTIVDAVKAQIRAADVPITTILLVGGFAASDWLFGELKRQLNGFNVDFSRPDRHVNKAVADGALSFYLDHVVTRRIARATYGAPANPLLNKTDPEHLRRAPAAIVMPCGEKYLPNGFGAIILKGTTVSEEQEFRYQSTWQSKSVSGQLSLTSEILQYAGTNKNPRWLDEEPGMYTTLCKVKADTSRAAGKLKPQISGNGQIYYCLEFHIVLLFGLTELKAELAWIEDGKEKRSPATIVYQ